MLKKCVSKICNSFLHPYFSNRGLKKHMQRFLKVKQTKSENLTMHEWFFNNWHD